MTTVIATGRTRDRMLKPVQVAAKIVDMAFSNNYGNGQSVGI
jgi:hypothetical protein